MFTWKVPWHFLDGSPVHFGCDAAAARNAAFCECPYPAAKFPWLDNVYFELYDATGPPGGDLREQRSGEPDDDHDGNHPRKQEAIRLMPTSRAGDLVMA